MSGDGKYTFEVERQGDNTSVRLHVAGLQLPITREQLVEILFGEAVILSHKRGSKPKSKRASHHDSASRERQSKQMKARFAKRLKAGLCVYDDKKRVKGSRYCEEHQHRIGKNKRFEKSAAPKTAA